MSIAEIEFDTPLGLMRAIADDVGVRLIDFHDRRDVDRAVERCLAPGLDAGVESFNRDANSRRGAALNAERAREQVLEYFAGARTTFDLPLNPPGTEFQHRVWNALKQIPFAETRTYAQQTLVVGPITALRAVAQANGQNFCAIVIPCHRVIGAQGELRGYGGGLERKRWLLDHESAVAGTAPTTLFAFNP